MPSKNLLSTSMIHKSFNVPCKTFNLLFRQCFSSFLLQLKIKNSNDFSLHFLLLLLDFLFIFFVCSALIVFILRTTREKFKYPILLMNTNHCELRKRERRKATRTSKFIFNDLFPPAFSENVCLRKEVNRKTISTSDKSSDSHQQSIAKYIIVISAVRLFKDFFVMLICEERKINFHDCLPSRRWYLNRRVAFCPLRRLIRIRKLNLF